MFSLPIVTHSNDTSIMILAFIVSEKSDFFSINNGFGPPQKFTFWALARNVLTTRAPSCT